MNWSKLILIIIVVILLTGLLSINFLYIYLFVTDIYKNKPLTDVLKDKNVEQNYENYIKTIMRLKPLTLDSDQSDINAVNIDIMRLKNEMNSSLKKYLESDEFWGEHNSVMPNPIRDLYATP